MHPLPLALDIDPYAFACDGPLLGVPHGLNVLTNLPFLVIGLVGLMRLARAGDLGRRAALNWTGLWTSVALLALGSGAYHVFLTPPTLAADRLAIAGIMAFLAAETLVLAVGVGPRAWLSFLLLVGAEATVVVWMLGGTSWLYGGVQALGGVAVLMLFLRAHRRGRLAPGALRPLVGFLLLYGFAKVLEALDEPICAATGVLGGHPLKHLVAAIGLAILAGLERAALGRAGRA